MHACDTNTRSVCRAVGEKLILADHVGAAVSTILDSY